MKNDNARRLPAPASILMLLIPASFRPGVRSHLLATVSPTGGIEATHPNHASLSCSAHTAPLSHRCPNRCGLSHQPPREHVQTCSRGNSSPTQAMRFNHMLTRSSPADPRLQSPSRPARPDSNRARSGGGHRDSTAGD